MEFWNCVLEHALVSARDVSAFCGEQAGTTERVSFHDSDSFAQPRLPTTITIPKDQHG
jgi:hypothetical protein